MSANTSLTENTANTAGVPPAPPEAHQRADGQRKTVPGFCITGFNSHPSEGGAIEEELLSADRKAARRAVLLVLARGYWVEVRCTDTAELLAGPFDPDAPLPSYTL